MTTQSVLYKGLLANMQFTYLRRIIAIGICIMCLILLFGPLLAQSDDIVDINTATRQELESVSGIGPITAQRIVEYRRRHNGFKSIEELIKINGIGEKRLSEIKLWVTISTLQEGEVIEERKPISESNKLNINKASKRDFELLPGIGPTTAKNITDYRTENNGFQTIQEMLRVRGIGERKFDRIKNLITTESSPEE